MAIRSLKITYGLMDPETYDATFFGACTARGLERLEFVEDEDLAYYYDQEDDDQEDEESDSDDDNEAADGNSVRPPKPRRFMDVRPFCFAPAPSGIRRYIDGWDVDEGTLVEACTKGLQVRRSHYWRRPRAYLVKLSTTLRRRDTFFGIWYFWFL